MCIKLYLDERRSFLVKSMRNNTIINGDSSYLVKSISDNFYNTHTRSVMSC